MQKTTNRRMVTVAMLVAVLLVAIDVTVVSTAMPNIARKLGGLSLYSWVFAIYTLTTCITTQIYGKLSDLFGRKVIFSIGVILFVIGSMLSGIAQTMPQLIWFRAFQGIGAGAVMPVTFTIIGDLFPGEQRAKMQGVFSAVWGVAGLLGPLMGGLFVDYASWRWIFYINLPVGIISLVLVLSFLHENFERKSKHIDYWGAIVFTVGISALLYALLSGGDTFAWGSGVIIGLFVIAAIFLALFVFLEAKVKEPMLPLSLFTIPTIAVSNAVAFLSAFILIGSNVYLPMWIQTILGHSATSSGLTLMPMSIAWPLGSTFAGRYLYKIGTKTTTVIGAILIVAGSAWMMALNLGSPYWYFVGLMIVLGLGMGYAVTATTVMIQSAVGWQMRGAATASNTFVRTLGQTIGATVFGTLFNSGITNYAKTHFHGGGAQANIASDLDATGAATSHIPSQLLKIVHETLAHGIHNVFVVIFSIAIVAFLVALGLPSHRKVMEHQQTVNQRSR